MLRFSQLLKNQCTSQTHEKMNVSYIEEIYSKYIHRARNEHPDLFRESHTRLIR